MPKKSIPPSERFWQFVLPEPNSGCWLWMAAWDKNGYGLFTGYPKRSWRAHRFAYELVIGPIASGLTIDHLCRVKCCVNPAHMEQVTASINSKRARRDEDRPLKTHCPHGHPYTTENTYIVKTQGNHRICRTCRLTLMHIRYRNNKSTGSSLVEQGAEMAEAALVFQDLHP